MVSEKGIEPDISSFKAMRPAIRRLRNMWDEAKILFHRVLGNENGRTRTFNLFIRNEPRLIPIAPRPQKKTK